MLSSVRRHSLRLQTELHRWSICDPGTHLLPDGLLARVPACISRSKSCASSAGESDGSRASWSSSDSVISVDSAGGSVEPGSPYRVVLLGASGVGKTAFASIFAGAADSMDSDDCELCGEARACAAVFDCKFIETSAAMQHNVWETFYGIVRQLRLRRDSKEDSRRRRHAHCDKRRESFPVRAKRFLDKVVAKNNPNMAFWLKSKSCHNLSVL